MYILRELQRSDIEIINNWRNDKDLISYLGSPFRYINKEIDERWYEDYLLNRNSTVRCAIIKEEVIIGIVSLTNIDCISRTGIFHIMIGDITSQNKGAGEFASIEILKHAFNNLNLNRIELLVLENNKRAIHLYEKLGFFSEGIKREAVFKDGKYQNMIIMSLLKKDFLSKEGKNEKN